jgi:hypothetical protein
MPRGTTTVLPLTVPAHQPSTSYVILASIRVSN